MADGFRVVLSAIEPEHKTQIRAAGTAAAIPRLSVSERPTKMRNGRRGRGRRRVRAVRSATEQKHGIGGGDGRNSAWFGQRVTYQSTESSQWKVAIPRRSVGDRANIRYGVGGVGDRNSAPFGERPRKNTKSGNPPVDHIM